MTHEFREVEQRRNYSAGKTENDLGNGGMNYAAPWAGLVGFGAGMLVMYILDPDRGRRRRALLGDKLTSFQHRLPVAASITGRDMANRARGIWAEASHLFSSDDPSDQVVEARVRSALGRVCSHPHSVHVTALDGHVTLDGVILAHEVPELLSCVEKTRGVKGVENRMREFKTARGIPSLQGRAVRESRPEFMQQNWSPAVRLAAGTAGTAPLAYGITKRDLLGLGLGTAGLALLGRSVSNIEFQRLFGLGGGRTAVTINKTINVAAPPDVVYALWSNFENFPQFMTNVLEVRNVGSDLTHWKVAGPAGVPIEWDAETTLVQPEEMIAWKSVEGSPVANAGYVLFQPNNEGGTEVSVRISYNPPGGAVEHAVAWAFGADPKTQLDADLMRMKTLLETGQVPHDTAKSVYETPERGRHIH